MENNTSNILICDLPPKLIAFLLTENGFTISRFQDWSVLARGWSCLVGFKTMPNIVLVQVEGTLLLNAPFIPAEFDIANMSLRGLKKLYPDHRLKLKDIDGQAVTVSCKIYARESVKTLIDSCLAIKHLSEKYAKD